MTQSGRSTRYGVEFGIATLLSYNSFLRAFCIVSIRLLLLICGGLVLALLPSVVDSEERSKREVYGAYVAFGEKECSGEFNRTKPSLEDLEAALRMHAEWLLLIGTQNYVELLDDPRRANLCGADLTGWRIENAKLAHANLSGANLTGASLYRSDLSSANLRKADLTEADLWGADLSSASLLGANFTNALLGGADLSYANLVGAEMSGSLLLGTHLYGTKFEPKPGGLPNIEAVAEAFGLSQLSYRTSPRALVELRQGFKTAGFRRQEREVTYAINAKSTKSWTDVETVLRLVLFELTTDWGMSPHRALKLILVLILFFSIPYALSIRLSHTSGIWRIWPEDELQPLSASEQHERLRRGFWASFGLGLYFSILTAFNIGWRDLNVGNWISRLQPRPYILSASGWVRTVAGVQSLASVFLLALWALTYFGRPFE